MSEVSIIMYQVSQAPYPSIDLCSTTIYPALRLSVVFGACLSYLGVK